ncbi:MAG: acetyltransferase (GNAT) family [halophilic archaeon J07HX64]|jgi:Acetyltransferase (GNAT) family.|nr:MAG: acetyltransferase (GNAT) family [halophilic archaeon J07HX64]
MDVSGQTGIEFRPATHDDYEDVVAFTRDTWTEMSDYIPDVYHDWIAGENRRTLVADTGDRVVGIVQMVLLSPTEAWAQGMRVAPEARGKGVAAALTRRLFSWAREQGAVVSRNMVFSWNEAGMGQSRSVGYEPVTEFRWLHPDPVAGDLPATVGSDPEAAWSFWTGSKAHAHLGGLGLDMDESWALRELTPEMLERAAAETALFTVTDAGDTRGLAYRTRAFDRDGESGTERWAEYGLGAWADLTAAETLIQAVAADAADCGADRTRLLIPEQPRTVSDGAYLRAELGDNPDFVFAADLTGD